MELKHQLTPQLKQLRLSGVLESLEIRHRQAIDDKWSYIEFLERLLQDECRTSGPKTTSTALAGAVPSIPPRAWKRSISASIRPLIANNS